MTQDIQLKSKGWGEVDFDVSTGTSTAEFSEASTDIRLADFVANRTSGSASLPVQFTDASLGDVTGWSWEFGDGGTSTVENPSHTYHTRGTYTVTLTVTGPDGPANTLSIEDMISVSRGGGGGRRCGFGFELALLLPPLLWFGRRRIGRAGARSNKG